MLLKLKFQKKFLQLSIKIPLKMETLATQRANTSIYYNTHQDLQKKNLLRNTSEFIVE